MKIKKLGLALAAAALILVAAFPGQASAAKPEEDAKDKAFKAYQDYINGYYGWYFYDGYYYDGYYYDGYYHLHDHDHRHNHHHASDLSRQKFLEQYFGVSSSDYYSRYDAWNDFYDHVRKVGSPYHYDDWDYARYLSKYYGGADYYYPAYWNWDYHYYPAYWNGEDYYRPAYRWYNGAYRPYYVEHNDSDLELDYVMHVNYYDDFINVKDHTPAPMDQRAIQQIVYGGNDASIQYPLFTSEVAPRTVLDEKEVLALEKNYYDDLSLKAGEKVEPVVTPNEADATIENYALDSLENGADMPSDLPYGISESEMIIQNYFLNSLTY